ncbi:MAG: hypothetical protein H8K10_15550 [Nitrospira sp.]|nr:hypothetical protein [Nitrospira sp.]
MVRMNGEDSRAMVESIGVEYDRGRAALDLQIAVPADEWARWMVGSSVSLVARWNFEVAPFVARWNFEVAPFPACAVLADVMERRSVQGQFVIRERYPVGDGGWSLVKLESSGAVQPLEP